MVLPLLIIPFVTLSFITWLVLVERAGSKASSLLILGTNLSSNIKLVTLLSFNVSLSYGSYLWKTYPRILNDVFIYPANSWLELQHNLSLPFILLSVFILIVELLITFPVLASKTVPATIAFSPRYTIWGNSFWISFSQVKCLQPAVNNK